MNSLVLLIALLPPQPRFVDYPFEHGIDPAWLGNMSGVCIVRSAGVSSDTTYPISRHMEQAVVVDSPAFPSGTAVRIVGSYRRGKLPIPMYSMKPGEFYLVVGTLPQAGKFMIPRLGTGVVESGEGAQSSDIYAVDVFPTTGRSLKRGASGVDSLFEDLVDCMPGQSPDETARIYSFMENMRPPQLPYKAFTSYVDTPLTRQIREVADDDPPVQRALLYQILVSWHVRGSQKPFADALIQAMESSSEFPTAYGQLDASLDFPSDEYGNNVSAYVAQFPNGNRKADALVGGINPYIENYVLNQVTQSTLPDRDHLHKVAVWLTQENQPLEVQIGAADWLAGLLGRNDLRPVVSYDKGVKNWQNRTVCLEFWKDAIKRNLIRTGKL